MEKDLHNLREYEIFNQILKSGSLTNAAKELKISQPALSQALANLEDRYGFKLFDRENNKLSPTPSALELNIHLEELFRIGPV